MLGKLFTSILNNRLYDYMVQKGILKAEQGGFRKMHGTVDSIFTLKMLIDKYLKSKPQKHRNLLFSCFVDFRKAFDCIPRQKLFDKLRNEGVQGRFLDVLISMYSNYKSAVEMHTWWSFLNIPSHLRENLRKSWLIYRKLKKIFHFRY